MSNMNSMEREQKKRQLKRRIVEPGSAPGGRPGKHQEDNEEEIVRKAERKTRLKRLRLILILIMLAAILVFLAVRYVRGHQYMEYTVAWEKEIPASESSFTGYMKFGENLLKYSKDGASYIDKSGNAVWSLSYQMKSPVCYVNGNFAVIGDQDCRGKRQRCFRFCGSVCLLTGWRPPWWRTVHRPISRFLRRTEACWTGASRRSCRRTDT